MQDGWLSRHPGSRGSAAAALSDLIFNATNQTGPKFYFGSVFWDSRRRSESIPPSERFLHPNSPPIPCQKKTRRRRKLPPMIRAVARPSASSAPRRPSYPPLLRPFSGSSAPLASSSLSPSPPPSAAYATTAPSPPIFPTKQASLPHPIPTTAYRSPCSSVASTTPLWSL